MSAEKIARNRRQLTLKSAQELMRDGKYNDAIELYDEVITEVPDNFGLYVNRSFCYEMMGQLARALSDANMAVELNPLHISGHYRKGSVHLKAKLFRLAEHSFLSALDVNPDDNNAIQRLTETHRQFLREFGFQETEIEDSVEKYKSCDELTDALLEGRLLRVFINDDESISTEMPRKAVTDSLSDISVGAQSIANSDDTILANGFNGFIPLSATPQSSINGSEDDIRIPKIAPFKTRSSTGSNESTPKSCTNSTPVVVTPTALTNGQSTPKTSKMVKTRPQIRMIVASD